MSFTTLGQVPITITQAACCLASESYYCYTDQMSQDLFDFGFKIS
jgi:hypothetical protein